jgi:hypothetical protein
MSVRQCNVGTSIWTAMLQQTLRFSEDSQQLSAIAFVRLSAIFRLLGRFVIALDIQKSVRQHMSVRQCTVGTSMSVRQSRASRGPVLTEKSS